MSVKTNFWVDLLVFCGFLIALEPNATGVAVHEWLAISLAATLIIHFLIHWDWYIKVSIKFFNDMKNLTRLNYILATLIFIGFVSIITSGLMISKSVLPYFGLTRPAGFGWRGIHETSVNLTMILVASHIGLHWAWIKTAATRLFSKSSQRTMQAEVVADKQ